MIYCDRHFRYEVRVGGENCENAVAWIVTEVPEQERYWWYRNVVLRQLLGV